MITGVSSFWSTFKLIHFQNWFFVVLKICGPKTYQTWMSNGSKSKVSILKIGSKISNWDTESDPWKIPFVITEGSLEQIRTRNWFDPLKPFSFRIVNTSLVSVWYWYCFSDDHLWFTCPADAFSFFKFLKNLKFHEKNPRIFENLGNF